MKNEKRFHTWEIISKHEAERQRQNRQQQTLPTREAQYVCELSWALSCIRTNNCFRLKMRWWYVRRYKVLQHFAEFSIFFLFLILESAQHSAAMFFTLIGKFKFPSTFRRTTTVTRMCAKFRHSLIQQMIKRVLYSRHFLLLLYK